MKKIINFKKIIAVLCIICISIVTLPIGSIVEAASANLKISAPSSYNVKQGGSVSFKLSYTNDIAYIGLNTGAIVLNGFTATKSISGSGNTRTVTLTNIQGNPGNKTVSITGGSAVSSTGDGANAVTSSVFSLEEADRTAPVLRITGPNPNTIYNGGTVTYTLNYSDNVGIAYIGLNTGAIVLNGFTATKSISGSGNTRTVTLTNIQGTNGSKNISVTGGTAVDAAGNGANAVTGNYFNIVDRPIVPEKDTQPPVMTIRGPYPYNIYNGETVEYYVDYSDNIGITNISLNNNNINLNGFTANINISGSGNTRKITLTNIQGSIGAGKYITISSGTASDAAGNKANGITSAAFNILTKDTPKPPEPENPTEKPEDWIPNPNTGK